MDGFTTNPTLMKKAEIKDYEDYIQKAIKIIPDKPLAFEIFSDDFETMEYESNRIAGFGKNIFVKIPIMNTKGQSSIPLIKNYLRKE